jgi:A/G-specific adenine glycosylase
MLRGQVYTDAPLRRSLPRGLLRWFAASGRDLPWRDTTDPYAILVSEVMLQQTQVSRVLPAYASFLKRFPTLRSLARASLGEALRAWSGLGYNRRARDLHRIARLVPSGLPTAVEALDALPGIGAYTAGAVACFAYGARTAFADTNIRRVLGRIVLGRIATEREAVALDAELAPRDVGPWHHALMDLGATICVARAPRCEVCPLASRCLSRGRAAAVSPKPRQTAFAGSDRRVRGRIIASLRAGDMTVTSLRRALDDPRVERLVTVLAEEGLVERRGRRVGLPA